MTADRSQERKKRLSNVDMTTFRELMTDAAFTTDARIPLEKPASSLETMSAMAAIPCMTELINGSAR